MPAPDFRTSISGYNRKVQDTLNTQGFSAALNYAKTAGAVGKIFVFDDGTQRTVREIDIRDDLAGTWVAGDGKHTLGQSYSTLYFYEGATLRMRVYLGW
jgi:hypothetical protein